MKQHKLCTIREFAEYIAEIIYTKREDFRLMDLQLPDYDFAIADEDREGKTLAEIAFGSGGWYGMKKFDAGFDSNDLCLITDYYGGGSAVITQIWDGYNKKGNIRDIRNMIIRSLELCGEDGENTEIIIEWEDSTNGNKYPVKITETLEKVVYVEAESKDEAWEKAQELWNDSEIILTADDFVKADFEAMESEEL